MKCGNLNFLEPSGPLQACNGNSLPFHILIDARFVAVVVVYLTTFYIHYIASNEVIIIKQCNEGILCFVDRAYLSHLANRTKLTHKFSEYVYCFSIHVSGNYVPIIRRKYRTYATPLICHSI